MTHLQAIALRSAKQFEAAAENSLPTLLNFFSLDIFSQSAMTKAASCLFTCRNWPPWSFCSKEEYFAFPITDVHAQVYIYILYFFMAPTPPCISGSFFTSLVEGAQSSLKLHIPLGDTPHLLYWDVGGIGI
jgi:hypothetical protein